MNTSGQKISAETLKVTTKPQANTSSHGNLMEHNLLLSIQFHPQQLDFRLKDHQF